MITRQKQLDEVAAALSVEYQQRLIAFFRDRAPFFIGRFNDDQLKQRITEAVPRARDFGLSSPEAIMQYVALSLATGSKFDIDLKVCEFMRLPDSTPEAKVKRLFHLVLRNLTEFGRGA